MEQFMPEADPNTRLQVLQDTAEKVENGDYYAPLTQEQIDNKRQEFMDNSVKIHEHELKLKELSDQYKGKIKPLKHINAELMYEVSTGQEKRSGNVYHIADYDNSEMITYNENGEYIKRRRLTPEEKKGTQSRLFIPSGFKSSEGTNG